MFITVKKTLKTTGQVETRTGSGFVISRSGFVLTNRHVIESDSNVDAIDITGAIASREASPSRLIVIQANQHDVALLKFTNTSKEYGAVVLGQVAGVKVGTHLCSEGFPANQEYFFVEGALSSTGGERGFWLTQIPSNPGDSGAPVFLASGEVVAIKVGGYDNLQDVNMLIPINLASDLVGLVPDLSLAGAILPDTSAHLLRIETEGLKQIRTLTGEQPKLNGKAVYCDAVVFSLVLAHTQSANTPIRVNSITVHSEVLKDTGSLKPGACEVDRLSSHPYGIRDIETVVLTAGDNSVKAKYIKTATSAFEVNPDNILDLPSTSRSITLKPGEEPFGLRIIVEDSASAPRRIWFSADYDANGPQTITSESLLIWR